MEESSVVSADRPESPPRPALLGPAALASYGAGADPAAAGEAAHATAYALVTARGGDSDRAAADRLLAAMDELGIETIAQMWAGRPARTLPGALWRLYALREWVRRDPAGASLDFRGGAGRAEVARVVAGPAEPPTPEALRDLLDAILGGAFAGDLAVALERAGAFARVVATGRACRADETDGSDPVSAVALTRRSANLVRTAEDLEAAAALWRSAELR